VGRFTRMGRLDALPRRYLQNGAIVYEATMPAARLLGLALLAERDLPPLSALLIPHCRSVHTFGMRFALDVLFLGEDGIPLRVARAVPPRRILFCRRAFAVLETRAGDAPLFSPPSPPGARAGASGP
jgi:uncharacterized protein